MSTIVYAPFGRLSSVATGLLAVLLGLWLSGCATPVDQGRSDEAPVRASLRIELGSATPGPSPRELSLFRAAHIAAAMSLPELAGQVLMPAVVDDAGRFLLSSDDPDFERLQRIAPGGYILFAGNISSGQQIRTFVRQLTEATALPAIVAIDHEGGTVYRFRHLSDSPVSSMPPARSVALQDDEMLVYANALQMGRELASLGIHLNFAPVADVVSSSANRVIGNRSFGSDPEVVGRMVAASVRGLRDGGVASVVKHFPGHGASIVDTHLQSGVVTDSRELLLQRDVVPFRHAMRAGANGVLTSHLAYSALDDGSTPATFSSRILDDLLRGELQFDGIVVSDALTMVAARQFAAGRAAAVLAINAGVDLILQPVDPVASYIDIVTAVKRGQLSRERLVQAATRIIALKIESGLLDDERS